MAISKELGIYKRQDKSASLVKRCPLCNNDFEVLIWQQRGVSKDRNKGWHKRVYCDTCLPLREKANAKARQQRTNDSQNRNWRDGKIF